MFSLEPTSTKSLGSPKEVRHSPPWSTGLGPGTLDAMGKLVVRGDQLPESWRTLGSLP
ncbi:MAG: hypothetical protein KGI54_18745 [Pseudomonadota bacterium]|nr:hypothetical protein [Pseudomonadota bacterium]